MSSEAPRPQQPNLLGRKVEQAVAWLEKNATSAVAVICVLLVGAAGYTWWTRQASATATAAWTLLEAAENVNDFANVAQTYKNTPAGDWATLRAAELKLKTGSDAMFTDRELGIVDLKSAREGFSELLASTKAEAQVRERAAWGMARALEIVSDGDTTKVIEAYQRLVTDFPETVYKPIAEERITALKTGGVKEFYAWFSKQSPKPADIRPKDGMSKSELDSFLPPPTGSEAEMKTPAEDGKQPDVKGAEAETKPAEPASKTEGAETSKDKPAADEKKPEATPDAKPNPEKPASEEATKDETKPKSDDSAEKPVEKQP